LPLLAGLRFDFNPLNLRPQDSESVATVLDLMNVPETSPDTVDVLRGNLAQTSATAEKLRLLPEVGRVLTLQSFVPEHQDDKLALIEDAGFFFQNTLNTNEVDTEPTVPQTAEAIKNLVQDLSGAAGDLNSPAAAQARRLATVLAPLATAPEATIDELRHALVAPLHTTLRQARRLLSAEPVSIETLPPALKQAWLSTDGRTRIEVAPKAAANDNGFLQRFVTAVRAVTPDAAGSPVFVIEAASSVVTAFSQAGILSIVAIALILFVALRRWIDVALTLVLSSVTIMAMSSSGCRRRLQDLLHHCVAVGGNKLPAIKPHAGHLLQRLHDRDCIREPVFLTSSRHIEHGQAHGSVAPDDPVGRSHFPAGSPGNPAGAAPSRFAGFRVCHFVAPHRSSRWTGSTV
jgi:hypothetical protein